MHELPCRWRGPELAPGHFACGSAKLNVSAAGVTLDVCAECYCRDHAPVRDAGGAAQGVSICRHLGGPTGDTVECETCPNKRLRLFVYACHHPSHGTTTLAACRHCVDRS